jgi:hypothetical protein
MDGLQTVRLIRAIEALTEQVRRIADVIDPEPTLVEVQP